jgi:hypothetical protein
MGALAPTRCSQPSRTWESVATAAPLPPSASFGWQTMTALKTRQRTTCRNERRGANTRYGSKPTGHIRSRNAHHMSVQIDEAALIIETLCVTTEGVAGHQVRNLPHVRTLHANEHGDSELKQRGDHREHEERVPYAYHVRVVDPNQHQQDPRHAVPHGAD